MSEGETDVGAWIGGTIGVIIGLILLGWLIRRISQGKQFTKDVRAENKVVIVTGSNAGIGKETVLDLASRGATVYMACRDMQKCDEARLHIIEKTGNSKVYARKLDLGSLESVRNFVKEFLEEESRLDILINNAGVMNLPRWETKDGFEMQLGVNHMGHFLLTNLLLDTLKASAPSRIVVVASDVHKYGVIRKDDLNSEKSYNKYKAYFQSKLANVLFVKELSKRLEGTGVTVNSLHPGVVQTELMRHQSIVGKLMIPFRIFQKNPKSGAQTQLTVALDPDLEKVSGKYFDNCKIKEEGSAAKDDEMAKWLWNISVEWTKSDQRF
ncbi:retinol dehydrogenase 12-like [Bradysia coprophila]|uniref:retinol dehydrogenase 12-like n=1 Tax=Bradysia coprophila TaxID=38358 RepID=UPI00187DD71E|nr:retinol dehydrogenase 12-like [Bradysia coprophila]